MKNGSLESTLFLPAVFEPFLKAYYDQYKYQSIDSYEFKQFLTDYFKDDAEAVDKLSRVVDWNAWFFQPGMPPYVPKFDDSMAKVCQQLRDRWTAWNGTEECPMTADDLKDFTSGQKIEFLALLLEEEPLSVAKLEKMQDLYGFDSVINSEIRFR